MMKKTIDVQQGFDATGHCVYTVRKARGKLTLDEIREAMTEYEQDYYGLVLKCMDEDMGQYYDDDLLGDVAELYSIESILEEWERVKVK